MVKAQKDQSTEQKILTAAREIFMEKGMDGARMQDIADRAGMNKALLHYYFRNKEKLFETIFTEAAIRFVPKISDIMSSDASLFVKIEQFVQEYIGKMMENPYLPLFILNEVNRQPKAFIAKMWGDRRPPYNLLRLQIEEEVKKGLIKPIEAHQLMVNMVSMCIFPFVARPMIQGLMQMDDEIFSKFLEARKKEVPKFIIDSIRK